MSEERRRHPRARVNARAQLKAGDQLVEASVHDICRDAVLVEADVCLPLGTEVHVRVDLPPPHPPLHCAGRVLRLAPGEARAHALAILFEGLSTAGQLRIDFLVETTGETGED